MKLTNNEAYNALTKITCYYNHNLSDEQFVLWVEELKPLNEIAVRKAINALKTNNQYENTMPTIPQFLSIYKTFINAKEDIQKTFCFVCNNRGYEIIRIFRTENDITRPYDYMLHCDSCELGLSQEINYKNYYSEPISKYFDVNKRIAENKKRYEKRQKVKKDKIKKALKETYKALSM